MKQKQILKENMLEITRKLIFQLNRPPIRWTQKDFHQIRINIRRYSVGIKLIKIPRKIQRNSTFQKKKLFENLSQLLKESGHVRDLDVAIKISESLGVDSKKINNLKHLRYRATKHFHNRWRTSRRHHLIQDLNNFIDLSPKISKRKYQRQIVFFKKNLKPHSSLKVNEKEDLHRTRKFFRKLRYFMMLNGFNSSELISIQNNIGKLHDLENLLHLIGRNRIVEKKIRATRVKLKAEGPELFFIVKKDLRKNIIPL